METTPNGMRLPDGASEVSQVPTAEVLSESDEGTQRQVSDEDMAPVGAIATVPRIEEIDPNAWGLLRSQNPEIPSVLLKKGGFDAPETGSSFAARYLFGRHAECDVVFTHQQISNRHCLVYKEVVYNASTPELCVFIEDMSTNGTYVNGSRLPRGRRYKLQHGDQIQLAKWDPKKTGDKFDDRFYMFIDPSRLREKNEEGGKEGTSFQDKYLITKELGSGTFATVKLAVHRETGQSYAVKIIRKQGGVNSRFAEFIRAEISILMAIDHPCVISIYGVYEEEDGVYIVLELVPGGELFDLISSRGALSERETRKLMFQILQSLKYLHDRGISHRDLKLENVLLVSKEELSIKITDFGLAKLVGESSFMKTMCGTPDYVAPEVLKGDQKRSYTKAVDLWSAGVIMFMCLCGYPPFSEDMAPPSLVEQIKRGKYAFGSPWWDPISEGAKDLVRRMLTVDPEARITADQALEHPWMQILGEDTSDPVLQPLLTGTNAPASRFVRGETFLTANGDGNGVAAAITPVTARLPRHRKTEKKQAGTKEESLPTAPATPRVSRKRKVDLAADADEEEDWSEDGDRPKQLRSS
ncbi:kinase-like domain-containing protein [Cladochytrium replicatum]|nr:kinase-like domain-containing protein [Cladochytrium replicatum]